MLRRRGRRDRDLRHLLGAILAGRGYVRTAQRMRSFRETRGRVTARAVVKISGIAASPKPRSIDEFRRLGRSTRTYAIEPPTGEPTMTTPAHPGRMLFVNIPVADLERSKAFFAKLGFSYNPMFTDKTAACMLVGEHAFVMLLSREKFAEFAKLPIADPTTHTLALYCFSVSSRDEVDTVSAAALAAGGSEADDAEDYGFMYSRSFFDLDGHGWQVMWMDPAAAEQGPEAFAASMQDAEAPV
jgi:predicted lactoylglutathione lyase